MAKKRQSQDGSWKSFLFGLVVIGIILMVIFIPVEQLRGTYQLQRESVQSFLGDAEEAIFEHSYQEPPGELEQGTDAIADAAGHDNPISHWARERAEVVWLWSNLISYRLSLVFAWMLCLMPLTVAAFVDGYQVREARKYAFFSQSPIRHKAGVRSAAVGLIFALASVGAPFPVTPLIIPAALLGIAVAGWFWISNLQKRL